MPEGDSSGRLRRLRQGRDRQVEAGDRGRQDQEDLSSTTDSTRMHAHRRHPRDRDPAEVGAAELRAIDFSEMTTSVVAVITDVMRDGKPVAGFAFNSTGRYACGAQMRARFIPRILKGRPEIAAQRRRRQSRSGENPRRDDAATRNPAATASARSASAPSRSRSGTRSPRSKASRCIACWPSATTAARCRTRCSATSAAAGTRRARPPRTCRTRCGAISIPATPW